MRTATPRRRGQMTPELLARAKALRRRRWNCAEIGRELGLSRDCVAYWTQPGIRARRTTKAAARQRGRHGYRPRQRAVPCRRLGITLPTAALEILDRRAKAAGVRPSTVVRELVIESLELDQPADFVNL